MKKSLVCLSVFFPIASDSFASGREAVYALFDQKEQEHTSPKEDWRRQPFFAQGEKTSIKAYEKKTYLRCSYTELPSDFMQINWKIHHGTTDQVIGEILLQYYPLGAEDLGFPQGVPLLRLRRIDIQESHRGRNHGSQALETLFGCLRQHRAFPSETRIGLEYPQEPPYLKTWYAKFGFRDHKAASFEDVGLATVALRKVRFPYHKKEKPLLPS